MAKPFTRDAIILGKNKLERLPLKNLHKQNIIGRRRYKHALIKQIFDIYIVISRNSVDLKNRMGSVKIKRYYRQPALKIMNTFVG